MEEVDLLLHARWVAPVVPDRVLENHALAVRAGRLVAVLPSEQARRRFAAARELERPTHLAIPGLVNAHGHAAMTLLRGLGDGVRLGTWLKERIWPLERRWLGPEFVADGTALAIAEMLQAGVTTFGDMYLFPEVVARAAADAGIRASVSLVVAETATAWAGGADEYFDKGLRLHDEYRGHPLVTTAFAAHSALGLADATLRRLKVLADQLELPVAVHLHESREEIAACRARHGLAPLARLDRLGLVDDALVAVHAVHLDDADVARLGRAGSRVVHCPTSNLKLGHGIAPVPALVEAGATLALGTDGAASGNDLDLVRELRLAVLLAAGSTGEPAALPPAAALRAATLGGAAALGIDDETGSLEPGKWADVACLDLARLPAVPVGDALGALAYGAGRDFVTDVWVAGRPRVADGRLTHGDPVELATRAADWRRRLLAEPRPVAGQ